MSVFLSPVGGAGAQFFDNNGNPLSGGKLYTYAAGTTTPQATYTSSAGATFHANPIILDAGGRVPSGGEIWLTESAIYKFVLKTSADVLLATWDNITGVNSNFINFTAETEYQTATAGQTVFTLAEISYQPGTGSLTVYVDGVNQYEGESYVETDSTTVTFTAGLHVGAEVKFTTAVQTTGNAVNASVVTYDPAGTGAVATTVQSKLRETISVKDFGAVGDGVTDDSTNVQAALDHVYSVGGGTVYFPEGTYLCNTPLVVQQGVNMTGASRESTVIKKDSTTTKAVTIYANPIIPQIYAPSTLPSNINAIVVLTGPGGRYQGTISQLKFESTLATGGDYESQKAEFGIVSVGSVSDFTFEHCYILNVQYALIFPTIFVAEIFNNRISNCLHGLGIDGGTSTAISSNYMNSCRTYGYFLRSLYYSEISGNACDSLNRNDWYPDRSAVCEAYVFRSCRGLNITANGQEQTLGRNWVFNDTINCVFEGNQSIGLGSDYIGSDEIAWIYSDYKLQNSTFRNNASWTYNSTSGLLFGGANAAQHHNIYFEGITYVAHNIFDNNMVFNSDTGVVVEAGWLNDVPTTWVNAATGGDMLTTYASDPTVRAQIQGDLNVTYLTGNQHYQHSVGKVVHVWGCFHMTITYTTASSYMIFEGFPYNQNVYWNIAVTGVEIATPLTKQLGSIVVNALGNGGIGKTPLGDVFNITDIPSGSTIRIFYDGWYRKDA